MNQIIIKGRIVHSPELKTTQSGVNVCRFSVAVDRRFKQNGEKVTDFFDCVAWRSSADFVSKYFDNGQEILLSGEMQSRQYEARDGSKRRAWEISVDNVEFCGSKQSGAAQAQPAQQQSAPAYSAQKQDDFAIIDDTAGDLPF